MKITLFMSIFLLCSFCTQAQAVANYYGIWQAFGNAVSRSISPEVRGRLCNYNWKDLEVAPNEWHWKEFDDDLTAHTQDGLPVIFMVYTKEDAPDWLYSNGVPKVIERNNKGDAIGYSPYYADPDYKYYFKRMIRKVHEHVETLSVSVRNKLIGVQGCFGSTGDYISYKGEVDAKYELSSADFYMLFQEFTQYYYDEYKNTNPKIALLSNPRNNGDDGNEWVVQNCPGGWLKCGTLGKAYQLNDELDKSGWLYDILNVPQQGSYVRARSEISGGALDSRWWNLAPYKNMFALMCYGIYWGLDWPNQGADQLTDKLFDSAFNFFNKYAGQKNAAKSTNAMCALKDALDASDDKRFPAAVYGAVNRDNQQRYKNIANAYVTYGAVLQDPQTATLHEMDNLSAKGINDVGWRIFPGNYERWLHQINANKTSAGYWNVQSADNKSMYGRFARGFDVAKNKNALYFDVDDVFLNNKALNGSYKVTIEITYLDNGGGSFRLYYDAKTNNNKPSISVTCGNTNKWKKVMVTLSDAYFGNRGYNKSDFFIASTNNKNVIFSVVELSRPKNFEHSTQTQVVANAFSQNDAQTLNNTVAQHRSLIIYPNPVQNEFSLQLTDGGIITTVEVYGQEGKLLLGRRTSFAVIRMTKKEIGSAGVYILKVFSGKRVYTTRVMVL